MSLLLDALKRAEQEKLARQGDSGNSHASSPAAESTHPSSASAERAAERAAALELQPIGTPAAAAAPHASANATAAAARNEAAVQGAQAAFQAKVAREDAKGSRGMLWASIGAIAIVVMAAGTYVFYSIQALAPKSVATPRPRPAPIPPPASGSIPDVPSAAAAASGSIAPPRAQVATSSSPQSAAPNPVGPFVPAAPLSPTRAAPASPAPAALAVEDRHRAPATAPSQDALARGLLNQPPAATAPVTLNRTVDVPKVPRDVASGYEALQSGNLDAARKSYAAAIAADSANVDAHLGLATVHARMGNRVGASQHYRRAAELDAQNPTALAGLASLADYSRPEALETQLQAEITRYPQSSALHFALGNLYASQARWREAQGSFFEAHRLDPGNGDIQFNLAVSLDHLGQRRLAGEFYARAIDAARNQSTQYDPAAIARRIAEMN